MDNLKWFTKWFQFNSSTNVRVLRTRNAIFGIPYNKSSAQFVQTAHDNLVYCIQIGWRVCTQTTQLLNILHEIYNKVFGLNDDYLNNLSGNSFRLRVIFLLHLHSTNQMMIMKLNVLKWWQNDNLTFQ